MGSSVSQQTTKHNDSHDLTLSSFPTTNIVASCTPEELRRLVTAAQVRYRELTGESLLKLVPPRLLTVSQAADVLKIAGSAIRRHCAEGNLDAIKAGPRCWIIPEHSLDKFRRDHLNNPHRPGPKPWAS